MIIKIDLKKAFDSIKWSLIEKILNLFHFDQDLISIIISCLTNVTFPIINGKKTTQFNPSKGILDKVILSMFLSLRWKH